MTASEVGAGFYLHGGAPSRSAGAPSDASACSGPKARKSSGESYGYVFYVPRRAARLQTSNLRFLKRGWPASEVLRAWRMRAAPRAAPKAAAPAYHALKSVVTG